MSGTQRFTNIHSLKESFIRMGVTAVKLAFQILEGKEEDIPVDNFINREALEKIK